MPIIIADQIICRADGTEKCLPFDRHLLKQFRVRFPSTPFAIDGVVAAESGEAIVLFVRPRVRAMC